MNQFRRGSRRATINNVIYSVNTLDPNKVREGHLVYDKKTSAWYYRNSQGVIVQIQTSGLTPSGNYLGAATEATTPTGSPGIGDYYTATSATPNTYTDFDPPAGGLSDVPVDSFIVWNGVEWVAQSPSSGDVVGPAGAVDGNLAVFDGTTGKLIKDGGKVGSVPAYSTPPANPSVGDTYFDLTEKVIKIWDGSEWVVAGTDALEDVDASNISAVVFLGSSGETIVESFGHSHTEYALNDEINFTVTEYACSNPVTLGELQLAFPDQTYPGKRYLKDTNTNFLYTCYFDGTDWYYERMTKATG